jgi:hypothetical protein
MSSHWAKWRLDHRLIQFWDVQNRRNRKVIATSSYGRHSFSRWDVTNFNHAKIDNKLLDMVVWFISQNDDESSRKIRGCCRSLLRSMTQSPEIFSVTIPIVLQGSE